MCNKNPYFGRGFKKIKTNMNQNMLKSPGVGNLGFFATFKFFLCIFNRFLPPEF